MWLANAAVHICLNIFYLFNYRFNYRSTHHLVSHGFYNFLNWFDERAWYPLGRIVGGTVRTLHTFVKSPVCCIWLINMDCFHHDRFI